MQIYHHVGWRPCLKFGTLIRDNRDANSTNGNFNGSFSFPSATGLCGHSEWANPGPDLRADCGGLPSFRKPADAFPNNLTYTTGPASLLRQRLRTRRSIFRTYWKFNRFPSRFSGGPALGDTEITPRTTATLLRAVGFCLCAGRSQRTRSRAKTVLRGGLCFFYDRFQTGSLMSLGTPQHQAATAKRRSASPIRPVQR